MLNAPPTAPAPGVPWTPPATRDEKRQPTPPAVAIEDLQRRSAKVTLTAAVDIALKNNPATRAAWADARAAAARYGSARGAWLPALNLNATINRSLGELAQGPANQAITETSATAMISYLIFDFGGRSGLIEEARQALLATDWTHNAVIQNTVLQTEMAFFNHAGAQSLLEANRISLAEAEANLKAAEERQRTGLATSADVLQARTAYAEVKLSVQATQGQVRVARGALVLAMGFPANTDIDFTDLATETSSGELRQTVDQLIERALASRPDLLAGQAQARQSAARVREARSRLLPNISATGNIGRAWFSSIPGYTDFYSAALSLQIPLFSGFSAQYDLLQAQAAAEAARERIRGVEQTVIFQVYAAHSDFLTANERLETTKELLASAQQSAEVALGRYREGVGSILDLLSAQRALAVARAEQVNARLSWYTALAQLAHDVGILGLPGENLLAPPNEISR